MKLLQLGFVVLAGLMLLSGCAGSPSVPPLIDIAAHDCVAILNTSAALQLSLVDKKQREVSTVIDGRSPCFKRPTGRNSLYAAFALPADDVPYFIVVESTPLGQELFAPTLVFLDASGSTTREVSRDAFLFRGDGLQVLLRSHPGERFVVAVSDPELVGQSFSKIAETTQTSGFAMGNAFVTMQTGADTTHDYIYAHGGKLTASVALPEAPKH